MTPQEAQRIVDHWWTEFKIKLDITRVLDQAAELEAWLLDTGEKKPFDKGDKT